MEDIPLLIEGFIEKMNRTRGINITGIDKETLKILMSHNYPGNIRELENIIEHAFILCKTGNIKKQYLPGSLFHQKPNSTGDGNLNDILNTKETRIIINSLERNNYNRMAAARELGMHKSTLFRKIKSLGITLPQIDGRSNNTN
jgi:transcriptional regulator with PAS, ATPase and Fis domain